MPFWCCNINAVFGVAALIPFFMSKHLLKQIPFYKVFVLKKLNKYFV